MLSRLKTTRLRSLSNRGLALIREYEEKRDYFNLGGYKNTEEEAAAEDAKEEALDSLAEWTNDHLEETLQLALEAIKDAS